MSRGDPWTFRPPSGISREKSTSRAHETPARPLDSRSGTIKPVAKELGQDSRLVRQKKLGEFVLDRLLGSGAAGAVYLAEQQSLGRLCAVKVLNRTYSARPDFVARFQREARAMARMDHPNVLRVYAVGEEHGLHYCATEYVDGKSLTEWMNSIGRFVMPDVLRIAGLIALGLEHAHESKLVHRDVKPENVLISHRGDLKVADFGLVKLTDENVSMTLAGIGMGTPLFMAPEQARQAADVDLRSDIYSVGSIIYTMATGVVPFRGKSTVDIILAKERGQYPLASEVAPHVPRELDAVIARCLARNPADRFQSCAELIVALQLLSPIPDRLTFAATKSSSSSLSLGEQSAMAVLATAKTVLPIHDLTHPVPPVPAANDAAALDPQASDTCWYVRCKLKGETVARVHQVDTQLLIKMIRKNRIPLRTPVSATPDGEFLRIDQISFFEAETRALQQRLTAPGESGAGIEPNLRDKDLQEPD